MFSFYAMWSSLIDAQKYFKSSLPNRIKIVKKPFAHESLENPLSCVSKCASENFHTLLFGLISNQATTLLQFMMGWRAVCSCHQSVTHIVRFE